MPGGRVLRGCRLLPQHCRRHNLPPGARGLLGRHVDLGHRAPTGQRRHRCHRQPGLLRVACAGPLTCVAAGTYHNTSGGQDGLLDTLSGTTWTVSTAPEPTGAGTGTVRYDGLQGGACEATGTCRVVGFYRQRHSATRPRCSPCPAGPGRRPGCRCRGGCTAMRPQPQSHRLPAPRPARAWPSGRPRTPQASEARPDRDPGRRGLDRHLGTGAGQSRHRHEQRASSVRWPARPPARAWPSARTRAPRGAQWS